MKILLHICCAPCTIYPLMSLREEGHDICGLFYNPNIHPYLEYKKRLDTLQTYTGNEEMKLIISKGYGLEAFLRSVVFREEDRCAYCYHDRLTQAAHIARRGKFDAFTTTLLYSKFQKHDLIAEIAHNVSKKEGTSFLYRDFRKGWQDGVRLSKEKGMYRQQYCGCIYSEKARFYRADMLNTTSNAPRKH